MKDGLCQVCLKKKGRYKCPGCKIKFCSTKCCKSHKTDSGCSGERKRSLSMKISLSDYKEEHFRDDMNFLEETQSHVSHLQWERRRKGMDDHTFMNFHKDSEKFVQRRVRERGTLLSFMPVGMKLRKMNTTCFVNAERRIYWRVHLVFHDHSDFTLENDKCSEDETVENLMIKSIQRGGWRKKEPFFEVFFKSEQKVRVYLKIPKEIAGNAMFYEIDTSKTLKENLKGKSVLEFPIFHVVTGSPNESGANKRFSAVSKEKEKELFEYEMSLIRRRRVRV